ncbi:hypothetical protein VFPBJ_06225 [Purpureocillium lilacinum]|nr:hypothetical protein VFPBJ_06225 [Purpureocillium lilacinum]
MWKKEDTILASPTSPICRLWVLVGFAGDKLENVTAVQDRTEGGMDSRANEEENGFRRGIKFGAPDVMLHPPADSAGKGGVTIDGMAAGGKLQRHRFRRMGRARL